MDGVLSSEMDHQETCRRSEASRESDNPFRDQSQDEGGDAGYEASQSMEGGRTIDGVHRIDRPGS